MLSLIREFVYTNEFESVFLGSSSSSSNDRLRVARRRPPFVSFQVAPTRPQKKEEEETTKTTQDVKYLYISKQSLLLLLLLFWVFFNEPIERCFHYSNHSKEISLEKQRRQIAAVKLLNNIDLYVERNSITMCHKRMLPGKRQKDSKPVVGNVAFFFSKGFLIERPCFYFISF